MDHIKLISQQVDLVRPYLLRAGLKVPNIVFNGVKIQEASQKEIIDVYHWITGFFETYCKGIDKAYSRIPESQWKHYENMGLTQEWEQLELKTAYRLTRDAWKNRPLILVTRKQQNERTRTNKRTRKSRHSHSDGGQLHTS